MKYDIYIEDNTPIVYWVMCGAFAVSKFYNEQDALNWINNNPDWDCENCFNC